MGATMSALKSFFVLNIGELDHTYTNEIVCPHCGYEYSDSWELNDYDGAKFDCGDCGKEFVLSVNVDVTYSTEKVSPPEEKADDPGCDELLRAVAGINGKV